MRCSPEPRACSGPSISRDGVAMTSWSSCSEAIPIAGVQPQGLLQPDPAGYLGRCRAQVLPPEQRISALAVGYGATSVGSKLLGVAKVHLADRGVSAAQLARIVGHTMHIL